MDVISRARALLPMTMGTDLVALLAEPSARAAFAEALQEIAADDFETVMFGPNGLGDHRHGVAGYLELWSEWIGAFDEFRYESVGEPVVGDDRMVNVVRQRGRMPGSAAEVTADGAAAWFFRDGRLTRIEFHLTVDEALRSAGLSHTAG